MDLHAYITMLLPVLVTAIAGFIRQDGWKDWQNDLVALGTILLVAGFDAFFDGRLGGNPLVDFLIVVSYCGVVFSLPIMQSLVSYLQSNVLVFAQRAEKTLSMPAGSVEQLLHQIDIPRLAALLASELVKIKNPVNAKPEQPPALPVEQQPTNPVLVVPNANGTATVPPAMSFLQENNKPA